MTKVGTSGLKVYGEVGLSYPLAKQLSLKTKVTGEYGFDSEEFAVGGEVKVRYSF